MKHTDLMRKERDLKKARKKEERLEKTGSADRSVGDFINELHDAFFFNELKIYNFQDNEEIMELFMDMKEELPEKQWDNVIRKAVRKTKVQEKDEAIDYLLDFLKEC